MKLNTNVDEVLADIERLERKREWAVQQQRLRDSQPRQVTGRGLLRFFLKCAALVAFLSWLLWGRP